MRILFDQVVYDMRNKGNIALLQMALRRIHNLWPAASLEVMTQAPHILGLYCPESFPVSVDDHNNWSVNPEKIQRIHRLLPQPILRILLEIREELAYHHLTPGWIKQDVKNLLRRNKDSEIQPTSIPLKPEFSDSADVEQAMQGADIFICTGGGYLVDSDKHLTLPVLKRLAKAKQMGKFTALVGQGVGQIEDPEFRSVAEAVLPNVDLISVREGQFAVPILKSLGVPVNRIMVSGDDAVELAYESRNTAIGNDIGVSIRLARYTNVTRNDLFQIRSPLHRVANQYSTRLMALPTSCSGPESDQFKIGELLSGYPKVYQSSFRFESITDLIEKVGRCRLVITGTFHPAVFALSQGIPVIGLAKSEEYAIKFRGLIDQFGAGCKLLYLDDEQLLEKLAEAIDSMWSTAESLRFQLLEAAVSQIQLSQLGYERLHSLYQSKK